MKNIRKNRGTSQKIFLIETIPSHSEFEKKFDVMGSTGNVYTVTIRDCPECTCPDFKLRDRRCKHIFFILLKVMKTANEDEEIYDKTDLKNMFANIPEITSNLIADKEVRDAYKNLYKNEDEIRISTNSDINNVKVKEDKKPVDDLCPICLDNLDNGEELDYCKFSCGKSIHKICFNIWRKKHSTCVFCRSEWNKKPKAKTEDNGFSYINVLSLK